MAGERRNYHDIKKYNAHGSANANAHPIPALAKASQNSNSAGKKK